MFLGKLVGKGIEGWSDDGGDFWSINTQDDMFGQFIAQLQADKAPLFPSNTTLLQWQRADFGLAKIETVNEGTVVNIKSQTKEMLLRIIKSMDKK